MVISAFDTRNTIEQIFINLQQKVLIRLERTLVLWTQQSLQNSTSVHCSLNRIKIFSAAIEIGCYDLSSSNIKLYTIWLYYMSETPYTPEASPTPLAIPVKKETNKIKIEAESKINEEVKQGSARVKRTHRGNFNSKTTWPQYSDQNKSLGEVRKVWRLSSFSNLSTT